jgi:hypothetical protein
MAVVKRKRLPAAKFTTVELTCREAVSAMGDFSFAMLSSECRLHFEEHLKYCADCTAFLRTYKKTIEAMGNTLKNHSRPTPVLKLRKPPQEHYEVKLAEELLN